MEKLQKNGNDNSPKNATGMKEELRSKDAKIEKLEAQLQASANEIEDLKEEVIKRTAEAEEMLSSLAQLEVRGQEAVSVREEIAKKSHTHEVSIGMRET